MNNEILQQIARKENLTLKNSESLAGGSINDVYKLETSSGDMIIKSNDIDRFSGMFKKEAAGLKLLKSADAFTIPEVISTGEIGDQAYLLLEYLPPHTNKEDTWQDFAESLAKLHRTSADTFGLDHDNYIGSLPQYNKTDITDAKEFYIEKRLKPQFEMANKKGGFSFGRLDRMYDHIKYFIPDEPPALIHGDLWGENYMLTEKGPALIDPAVAYAPREMDIGMMHLFGGFPKEAFSHYQEIFPLEDGWEERIDIWQLYYLLVHLNLFGQNYFHPITRIMRRFQ